MGLLSTIGSRLGFTLARAGGTGGWLPMTVREPYQGAWQQNVELSVDTALSNPTVFRCVSLIAGDISKTPLRLVALDDDGIWTETSSPAFSPVLRKPNRYQTIGQFLEQWMFSKLLYGNTYVLKERDDRGVVVALYVLDPKGVTPLVAPDGSVFYQLKKAELAGLTEGRARRAGPRDHPRPLELRVSSTRRPLAALCLRRGRARGEHDPLAVDGVFHQRRAAERAA